MTILPSIRFSQPGSLSAGSVLTIRATSIFLVAQVSRLAPTAICLMTVLQLMAA